MQEDAHQNERLAILTAFVAVLARRDELLDLIDRCRDRDATIKALTEAPWKLTSSQSRYVLDMRLDQMTMLARKNLEVELAELRRHLGLE
ncbi:MAG: hypothetical protein AB7Q27_17255 [Acidimicrobiia bacterium]